MLGKKVLERIFKVVGVIIMVKGTSLRVDV